MPNTSMKVHSSHINTINYDNHHMLLSITFNDGSVYNYNNVPAHVYEQLAHAGSKGSYLHNHIKGKYVTTKLR